MIDLVRQLATFAFVVALFAQATPGVGTERLAAALPPEARASFERADRALVESDFATATRELARVVALAPEAPEPYAYYAFALFSSDRAALAVEADRYRRLAEASPDRAVLWYAYGRFEQDRAKREAAFRRAVELAPNAPWGHLGLGFSARVAGDAAAALPHYERAYAVAPKEPAVLAGLVALYAAIPARRADAFARLGEVARLVPGTFFAENAADAYAASLGEGETQAFATFYIEHYPEGRSLGYAYDILLQALASKDRALAATRARAALARLPGPRRAAERGIIFERYVLGDVLDEGRAAVDRLAAEIASTREDSPYVYLALGRAYLSSPADLATAARHLVHAERLYVALARPDVAFANALRFELGRALERAGDHARAAEALEKITPDAPVAADASVLLADLYARLGEKGKAFEAATRAVALRPLPASRERLAAAALAAGKSPAEVETAVWASRDAMAKPAAEFTLSSLSGGTVSLSSLRGKVVLLTFWFPS